MTKHYLVLSLSINLSFAAINSYAGSAGVLTRAVETEAEIAARARQITSGESAVTRTGRNLETAAEALSPALRPAAPQSKRIPVAPPPPSTPAKTYTRDELLELTPPDYSAMSAGQRAMNFNATANEKIKQNILKAMSAEEKLALYQAKPSALQGALWESIVKDRNVSGAQYAEILQRLDYEEKVQFLSQIPFGKWQEAVSKVPSYAQDKLLKDAFTSSKDFHTFNELLKVDNFKSASLERLTENQRELLSSPWALEKLMQVTPTQWASLRQVNPTLWDSLKALQDRRRLQMQRNSSAAADSPAHVEQN